MKWFERSGVMDDICRRYGEGDTLTKISVDMELPTPMSAINYADHHQDFAARLAKARRDGRLKAVSRATEPDGQP